MTTVGPVYVISFWLWFLGLGFFPIFYFTMLLLFQGSFLSEIFAVSAQHWQFSVWDNCGLVFREIPFIWEALLGQDITC